MAFRVPPMQGNYQYAPVNVHTSRPKRGRALGLLTVAGLMIVGVALALAHHLFYRHLDGKSIDPAKNELPTLLQDQSNVGLIGTAIAHGVRIAFSMAIGVTFGQLFWSVLRSRSHSIAQIDALVNCRQSPFSLSSFKAITASFSLFTISVITAATALIVVLSPGALTVTTNSQRTTSCKVPSIPQSVMYADHVASDSFPMISVMVDVLASNGYMQPFQVDPSATCGSNLGCTYNLTFLGPAAQCIDVTDQANFSDFMDTSRIEGTYIWDCNNNGAHDYDVYLKAYDMTKGQFQAANCTAYNATYHVGIEGNPPTVHVWSVTNNSAIATSDSFINFMGDYAGLAMQSITGTIYVDNNNIAQNSMMFLAEPQLNEFFEVTPTGNHTFSSTLGEFATSLVQNATLSLLSGNIAYNFTGGVDTASNLESVDSACVTETTVYQYDSKRLLATYGAALAITVLIVAIGCGSIILNGREQDVAFLDIVHIGLNDELFAVSQSGAFDEKTKVYLDKSSHRLLPANPIVNNQLYANTGMSYSSLAMSNEIKPRPYAPSRSCRITGAHVKMVLLILATTVCLALHHAYYQYLNGKTLTSNLKSPLWYRDQAAVSAIGTALSYLAQVFLGVSISAACVQILWRVIRNRGHAISQIDALVKVSTDPLSLPLLSALGASLSVPLVALLAASTTLVSVFAPSAIVVNTNYNKTQECTVLAPRDLSTIALVSNQSNTDYLSQNAAVISLGTYFPPVVNCDVNPGSRCSYDLQFTGPGFSCENVTATADYASFVSARYLHGSNTTMNLFQADLVTWPSSDNRMVVTVETYDVKRQEFQAVNCTAVSRSYSVTLSREVANPGRIDVIKNEIVDIIHMNLDTDATATSWTFDGYYMYNLIRTLEELAFINQGGSPQAYLQPNLKAISFPNAAVAFGSGTGGIGSYQLDGNVTWQANMSSAVEALAQNVTLSMLSDKIFNFNPNDANVLTNTSTMCSYTGTVYVYTPFRLVVTYAVAIAVAVVCAVWGAIAVAMNGGVEETTEFSRMLKGLLNVSMFNARQGLDERTKVKADDGAEGSFVPNLY